MRRAFWLLHWRRLGQVVGESFLWLGACLGLGSIIAAVAVLFFGFVPLIFTSGSMAPEIPAGSLGIARTVSADEVRQGDVVSVQNTDGVRITHRVVAVENAGKSATLRLKGDANATVDQERYQVTQADRLWFAVPYLGRLLAWASAPWVAFAAGILAASVLWWAFWSRSSTTSRDGKVTKGTAFSADGSTPCGGLAA